MGVVKEEEVEEEEYQHYHFIIADVEDEGEGEQAPTQIHKTEYPHNNIPSLTLP